MAIYKNQSSQKLPVYAYNIASTGAESGDASNITAQISIDGGSSSATNDTNPTELDAANHKGIYIFDLTQAETNGDLLIVNASSSTANVVIEPVSVFTAPGSNSGYDANVVSINDNTAAAVRLALSAGQIIPGTVTDVGFTTTTTEFEAEDISEATNDHYNNRTVLFTTGSLTGQVASINDYSLEGGYGHFTTSAVMTDVPASGDTFLLI